MLKYLSNINNKYRYGLSNLSVDADGAYKIFKLLKTNVLSNVKNIWDTMEPCSSESETECNLP